MNENNFTASLALQDDYVKRKATESKYSILFGILIFVIVGMDFYLKLDHLSLVIINLIVIAVPIGTYIYMSMIKQGNNMNKIVSTIIVNENKYQITSYSFEAWLFKKPAINSVMNKNEVQIQKVEFPFNEDGLEINKKETIRLIVNGQDFYLLYKYFPETLLPELMI